MSEFSTITHTGQWLQQNQSVTLNKGSIRGMHYQLPPFEEIKLIRCVQGSIFDVVVDIRKDSPTFLKHFSIELSAHNNILLYVPMGFAHGFQTLTDNCTVLYNHSQIYQPGFESGLMYNDPLLNINWPLTINTVSNRDNNHPLINNNFKGI
jgi:dTDP-4-dehydrorhamnose 3,5-epimerase